MLVKFFDGKQVNTYENLVNVQLLERTKDNVAYVITTDEGKRITVYAELIFCEVGKGDNK